MAPRLIARAHEIGLLDEAMQQLVNGTGGCIGIIGEAGIGKSSILAAWLHSLAGSDVLVRSTRAIKLDEHRPLAVLHRLFPDLADAAIDEVEEAVLIGVERLASCGPVALVLDDVQHADPMVLDVLPYLCDRAGDLGVLIVVTLRPDRESSRLAAVINAIAGAGTCVSPSPFDDDGLRDLVALRMGARCGPALFDALTATAGNPFLADEYLRCLADDGSLEMDLGTVELAPGVEPALSDDLGTRLVARVMAGVPDGYDVLRTIAVLPDGASPDEIAELLELRISRVTETCLRAVEAGALSGSGVRLGFRHDLLRRAVADRVPPAIARSIARRAGDLAAKSGGDPARIAACWLAGFDPNQPGHLDRLYELGCSIGVRAPAATAALLAPVVAHLSRTDARMADAVRQLGWSLVAAGRAGEVSPMLDRLGPRPGEDDEGDRLRDVADSLSGGLGRVLVRLGQFDPSRVGSTATATDGATVDSAAHAALLLVAGRRFGEAADLVDWITASPTPSGPLRTVLTCSVRAWLASTTGRFDEGVELSHEALRWAGDDRVRWLGGAVPTVTEALCLGHLGRIGDALDRIRLAESELRTPSWGPPLLHAFGTGVSYRCGRWDDALAEYAASRDASGTDVHVTSFYSPEAFAALVTAARDGPARGRFVLYGAAPLPVHDDRVWPVVAHVLTLPDDGSDDDALALISSCVESNSRNRSPAHLLCGSPDLAWFAARRGRLDIAHAIADQIALLVDRSSSPYVRTMLQWTTGITTSSPAAIEHAARDLAAAGYETDAARAGHHAAVALARTGASTEAATVAGWTLERYRKLGADAWSTQLGQDLGALGVALRRPKTAPRARFGWHSLTPSESRVVDLVAEGLTNAEIAARLAVSRRTVEAHLRGVYVKVGLSTRPQLLRAALERLHEAATETVG